MVLATNNWTAHGQPSTGTDSVTISREQQRQCIKWYNSIVYYEDSIIPTKDTIIKKNEEFIQYQEDQIQERDTRINKHKDKLKRRTWISAGAGAAATGIIAWLLFGLVN